jgi:transposase-like protein
MAKPELKAECIRLRIEERLSYKEIARRTGASTGTLSLWLGDLPLTEEELKGRQEYLRLHRKPRPEVSKFYLATQAQVLTRAQKARIAEAAILFRLVLHGFVPFGAAFDGEKTDWLVDTGSHCVKVQVKWAREQKGGLPFVSLICVEGHNQQRRYKQGELDFIVGYDLKADLAYVWSWVEIAGHERRITVSPEAEERWDKLRV